MKLKSKKVISVCFLVFFLFLAILPKLVQSFNGIKEFNHRFDKIESDIQFIKKKVTDLRDKESKNVDRHDKEKIFDQLVYRKSVYEIFNGQGILYIQYDKINQVDTLYINLEQKIMKWNNIKSTERFIFNYKKDTYYLTILSKDEFNFRNYRYGVSIVKIVKD